MTSAGVCIADTAVSIKYWYLQSNDDELNIALHWRNQNENNITKVHTVRNMKFAAINLCLSSAPCFVFSFLFRAIRACIAAWLHNFIYRWRSPNRAVQPATLSYSFFVLFFINFVSSCCLTYFPRSFLWNLSKFGCTIKIENGPCFTYSLALDSGFPKRKFKSRKQLCVSSSNNKFTF